MSHPIGLALNEPAVTAAHAAGTDAWWLYATEVLDHLRLGYRTVDPRRLPGDLGVLIMATAADLTAAEIEQLDRWLHDGGVLIGVGDPGGLAGLIGAEVIDTVDHDHVDVPAGDLITSPPDVALHAVGGVRLRPTAAAEVLATWTGDRSAALLHHRYGSGAVIWSGADLWQSIVRIQQGYPVTADGKPATDGSAPIDDDILKCEDGMALDLESDRALPPGQPESPSYQHGYPPETGLPMFHRPHADLWRSVFLQCLSGAAARSGVGLAWLHYWPAGVPAIAHMSHDSDLNVEEHGRAALDAFAEAGVQVTWCQVFPGGYEPQTYAAITDAGHEHALHYNAMADADLAHWGWPQMRAQYAWAQAVTGTEQIVSNKNHYTRWEGFTEFYRWCERLGIQIDESRGPSKQGTVGFPFGTAHVSFPIADAADDNRYHDVLNLPLHTQDLAWAGHESIRDVIIDGALQQHGVAHFLFHGPHLHRRPETRKACIALAEEVRRRGMQWWTAGQINAWERLRRTVEVSVQPDDQGVTVVATADHPVDGAAILIMIAGGAELRLSDGAGTVSTVRQHGIEVTQLAADIPAGTSRWRLDRE